MMRGDKKWPPEQTRQQMFEEEEAERKIAEGPAFKPKKAQKVADASYCQINCHSIDFILRITGSFSTNIN